MEWHEVTSPLWSFVVRLGKNAPSIAMGERLVADKPRLKGSRSLCDNLHAKKSVIDHKSD